MNQRFTLLGVPEAASHQSTPLAQHPQWARGTGMLGALACWALVTPLSRDENSCPAAPGPVYGRSDACSEGTLSFGDLRTRFAQGNIIHISPDAGDPAGLLLAHHLLGEAVNAGSVLIHTRTGETSVWIPSIDSALHRPTVMLSEIRVEHRDNAAMNHFPQRSFSDRLTAGSQTLRAGYRQALLNTLSAVEALELQIFDSPEPQEVRLPQLPRSVTPERVKDITGVLTTLELLQRIRFAGENTSAGPARQQRLMALAAVTADLQREARHYLDVLWTEAINDCAFSTRA